MSKQELGLATPIIASPVMKRLHEEVERIAKGTISVLLFGETGVGKEVFAERIHACSPRCDKPLIRLNCANFSENLLESDLFGNVKGAFTDATADRVGLLESAQGGTVFLDEIGEMPMGLQAHLLRVLEKPEVRRVGATSTRQIDVRFVTATNCDLSAAIKAGRFRQDLYFRICKFLITIPPLRDRPEEILPLAEFYLKKHAQQRQDSSPLAFSMEARAALQAHTWTGNVRELSSAVERAVARSTNGMITPELLALAPEPPTSSPPSRSSEREDDPVCSVTTEPESANPLQPPGRRGVGRPPKERLVDGASMVAAMSRSKNLDEFKQALWQYPDLRRLNLLAAELNRHLRESSVKGLTGLSETARVMFNRWDEQDLTKFERAASEHMSVTELITKVRAGRGRQIGVISTELRSLNGQRVHLERARVLGQRVREALADALTVPKHPHLNNLWAAAGDRLAKHEGVAQLHGDFSTGVVGILRDLATLRQTRPAEVPTAGLVAGTLKLLTDRLENAATAEWSLAERLFFEYLIGLGYFEVLVRLGAMLRGDSVSPTDGARLPWTPLPPASSFVDGLRTAFEYHRFFLRDQFGTMDDPRGRDAIWQRTFDSWNECMRESPSLGRELSRVVRMRPSNPAGSEVVTMAQILHWEAWGGKGQFIESFLGSSSTLLALLARYADHAFNWHGLEGRTNAAGTHFRDRFSLFKGASGELLNDAAECSVALLLSLRTDGDRTIRIWGDAVGPTFVAERRLISKMVRVTKRTPIELVLTEASPLAWEHLLDPSNWEHETLTPLWRDLLHPFEGEPGCPVSRGSHLVEFLRPGTYDLYSCAVALHQIADHATNRDRIRKILAFATRLLREGGVISVPDVGAGRILEAWLLPINLVDREGGTDGDWFSDIREPNHRQRIRFSDVASNADGRYLCEWNESALGGRDSSAETGGAVSSRSDVASCRSRDASPDPSAFRWKVPIPIRPLRMGSPKALFECGLPVYEFTPYVVVTLTWKELQALDRDWATSDADRIRLVSEIVSTRPALDDAIRCWANRVRA